MDRIKAMGVFIQIAAQGSMSAAAHELGVANSVVSKNLNQLESWLGVKLIYRSTRSLRLTPAGEQYLALCQDILERVDKLESRAQASQQDIQGDIRITAPLFMGRTLLTPLLPEFEKRYPLVSIRLVLSDNFRNMVDEGFDIALRVSQMPDSNFISRRLQRVKLKLIASPDYLEKSDSPCIPADLPDHRTIIETGRHRWLFRSPDGRRFSITPRSTLEVNQGEMIRDLCLAGMGIAQLPDFFVNLDIASGRLVELLPDHALDDYFIHLLYHQRSAGNRAIAALINFLVEKLETALLQL